MVSQVLNVLFVCSRNQWRSPTGEAMFRRHDDVNARSAGTASSAKRRIKVSDIEWADVVFAMEDGHASRLRKPFRDELSRVTLYVLDIPDDYGYIDPELVEMLDASATSLLAGHGV